MVIRRSSAAEIQALLADLDGTSEVRREAAVARLSIIGGRAVQRLVAALKSLSPPGRVAAFQALESSGDLRALDPALAAFEDEHPEIAASAVAVARACLRGDEGTTALDHLTSLAIDTSRPDRPRLLALDALAEVPAKVIAPILDRLATDPSATIRARAAGPPPPPPVESALEHAASRLLDARSATLPADPSSIVRLVADHGADAPLPTLHHLVEVTRQREDRAVLPASRQAWAEARAAVHLVLARRGSNVALYDLRETVERASGPVPADFLASLALVGDETCLEPIVMAYARSAGAPDTPAGGWQGRLLEVFRQIVKRERLTGRHSVMRRIRARWPGAVAELEAPRRKRGGLAEPVVSG